MEVRSCMRYLVAHPQPSYLRIGKAGEPVFHAALPTVAPGGWIRVASSDGPVEGALVSTGATLALAMEWRQRDKYRNFEVYSLPLWGMATKRNQPGQVSMQPCVVTLEDHLYDGGFGSWMMEAVAGNRELAGRIVMNALTSEVCGTVASQQSLNAFGGLA